MRPIRGITICIFLLSFNLSFAQSNQFVRGKIVDSKSNEPIVFASVKLVKAHSILGGVVSNEDGSFQFPAKYLEEADSLVITCIGYSKQALKTNSFNATEIAEIRLKTAPMILREVVVSEKRKNLSARKIVQFAIETLLQNCPTQPFSYIGYYRDYQKDKDQYVNLNEALVKVYDCGFGTNDFDSTKIRLYQYRQNSDFQKDSLMAMTYDAAGSKFIPGVSVYPFGGNELSQLRIHDAIRNHDASSYSFVGEFDSDFLKNHSFKLLDTVALDNVSLYHISFQALRKVNGPSHFATGEIFIERGNYGIHKLTYYAFTKTGNALLYSVNVEYTRTNGKLYPNYISLNNFFLSNTGKTFKAEDIQVDRRTHSFVVTFNHPLLKQAALYNKDNYEFTFDGQPMRIDKVEVSSDNDKAVVVSISKHLFDRLGDQEGAMNPRFNAHFWHLRDVEGRQIDRIFYKPVNQFREFFLQHVIVEEGQKEKGSFISKETRLIQNKMDSENSEVSKAWMNTPLIKSLVSH